MKSTQLTNLSQSTSFVVVLLLAMSVPSLKPLRAQITVPRVTSATGPLATLEEQLINRLKATTDERRNYVRLIVRNVESGRLTPRLVIAIERYAIRRNPEFPFPFFERALRFEAAKIGVSLPTVRQFASTQDESVLP